MLGKVDVADQLARQITSPDEDRFFIGGADGRTVVVLSSDPQNGAPSESNFDIRNYSRYAKRYWPLARTASSAWTGPSEFSDIEIHFLGGSPYDNAAPS